eukprot:TRINITY_DN67511_c3_g2_i1.p2 TRINITY_DN67511_c3_g2~~TRINITY_DN67511_c3_g2_i1.p2  ORF type:complete len:357 (-),score=201.24 TRINITY_DN67511_c3_g2_i1:449-1519(-)
MSEAKEQQQQASAVGDFPVVELGEFIKSGSDAENCKLIADLLCKHGLLVVRNPTVPQDLNGKFIDMMEKYFGQDPAAKKEDERADIFYQVGVTPSGIERARNHCSKVKELPEEERPVTICPPGVDPKWRFFWRLGEPPKETKFKQLNAQPVVPKAFPKWAETMDTWGNQMLDTVRVVARMAAIGFGLPENTFVDLMKHGAHLLAPTGSDLEKFGDLKTVFANFHTDLNFLTIHGKSRFPGLFVWTREGKRVMVKVPDGCLLLQAGQQFEHLTGGKVLAGFHEVVVCPETRAVIERKRKAGESLWRVSSTCFTHLASDNMLKVLDKFATEENVKKYPPILAGDQVQRELDAIKLGKH